MVSYSFGDILRGLLKVHQTNQTEFAATVGLSPATLSRRLNSEQPPDERELRDWWARIGWPNTELEGVLAALRERRPPTLHAESLRRLAKLGEAFGEDPLMSELCEGGLLYRLAAELAIANEASATQLRAIVVAACEMHELGRGGKAAEFAHQLHL